MRKEKEKQPSQRWQGETPTDRNCRISDPTTTFSREMWSTTSPNSQLWLFALVVHRLSLQNMDSRCTRECAEAVPGSSALPTLAGAEDFEGYGHV